MHERIRGLLAEHAAGGLDAERRSVVEAHLAGCADCRAELAEWQALAGALTTEVAGRAKAAPAWTPPEPIGTGPVSQRSSTTRLAGHPWLALMVLGLGIGIAIIARSMGSENPIDGWVQHSAEGSGEAETLRDLDASGPGGLGGALGSSDVDAGDPIRIDRLPTPIVRAGGRADDRGLDSGHDAKLLAFSPASEGPGLVSTAADAATPEPSGVTLAPPTATPTVTSPPDETQSGEGSDRPEPSDVPPATETPPPTDTPIVMVTSTASPTQATTAWLRGRVHGPDGYPRAEIPVIVERLEAPGEHLVADTDIEGRYAFELPAGRWILHAEAPAYQLMWHAGQPNPLHADPIELAAGDERQVDFYLEPHPDARIEGQLLDGEDRPIAGALVLAAFPPDPESPEREPRLVWSAISRDDGRFSLALPPRVWYLAVMPDAPAGSIHWWGGDGSLEQADRISVTVDSVRDLTIRLQP